MGMGKPLRSPTQDRLPVAAAPPNFAVFGFRTAAAVTAQEGPDRNGPLAFVVCFGNVGVFASVCLCIYMRGCVDVWKDASS